MSFPKYPEYKDSGISWLGKIPARWNLKPLKYVASCNDEALPENTPADFEIMYAEISDVDEVKGISNFTRVSFEQAPSRARRIARNGDVLVSTVRTYLRAIAPVEQAPENLIVSTGFAVVRPQGLGHRFAGYLLRAEWLISRIISRSVGVNYPAIRSDEIMALSVPVPSIEEQGVISDFLDHETARIDALIEEQQRLIELLKEKRQAVISHAVTKGLDPNVSMKDSGVEWLGEVPEHWKVTRVKHIISTFEQGWSPQCENVPVSSDEEWGVLKVGCVNRGDFDPKENKLLPRELEPIPELSIRAGDVLISRANTRELVGSAAVANSDFPRLILCDKLYRLRTTEACHPEYLSSYTGIDQVRPAIEVEATGASSSMLNIGQDVIKELPMPLPPVSEQETILFYLEENLAMIGRLQRESTAVIDLLKERRSALISAAVTGKIDVRTWRPEFESEEELPMAAEQHATYEARDS